MELISKPRNIVSKHRKRWPTWLLIKAKALGCGANVLTHCLVCKSVQYRLFERQLTIHLKSLKMWGPISAKKFHLCRFTTFTNTIKYKYVQGIYIGIYFIALFIMRKNVL